MAKKSIDGYETRVSFNYANPAFIFAPYVSMITTPTIFTYSTLSDTVLNIIRGADDDEQ